MVTKEDLLKIEDYLQQRSVRDTQLPIADPLTGKDSVPIIQDNENKILRINDFISHLDDLNMPDFYNVSKCQNKTFLELKDAINLVPKNKRKLGLVITYHNENGNWLIYQFKGTSVNQWGTLTCWTSILQEVIDEYVFFPDEEDITGVQIKNKTYLKFKNRDYDPKEFSGMGMIILRKNLKGTEACAIDDEDHMINILKQEAISQENTIYYIRYSFDLDGRAISIPKGCTLVFDGGSINNGTVYLQETAILGAFEEADMGTATFFGTYNTGQVFTFIDAHYPEKTGKYFKESTVASSATQSEDPKQDKEVCYVYNEDAYTRRARQELKWWDGKEWRYLLDITDYEEIKSIIRDLTDKHNAEMSANYRYFKMRCYALEQRATSLENRMTTAENDIDNLENRATSLENRMSSAEGRLNSHDSTLSNHESRISTNERNITNIKSDITNIQSSIQDLGNTIVNLDSTINEEIRKYLETHTIGVASVTVNSTKYTPDAQGNITLPDYPEGGGSSDGGTADKVAHKLIFKGAVIAEYDGSKEVSVNIPTPTSGGGTADKTKGTLTFTGAATGTFDGSDDLTINIPQGGGGDTTAKETLTIKQGSNTWTYNGTVPTTITLPEPTDTSALEARVKALEDMVRSLQDQTFTINLQQGDENASVTVKAVDVNGEEDNDVTYDVAHDDQVIIS